jgi:hypothetical protein
MTAMKKNKLLRSLKKKLDKICKIEEITPERFSQFVEVLAEFKNLLRNSHDN